MSANTITLNSKSTGEELNQWMEQNGLTENDGTVYTALGQRLTLTMFAAMLDQVGIPHDEVISAMTTLGRMYDAVRVQHKGDDATDEEVLSAVLGLASIMPRDTTDTGATEV